MDDHLVSLDVPLPRVFGFKFPYAGMIPTSADQHDTILAAFRKSAIDEALKAIELNYTLGMQVLLRKMGEE